MKFSKEFIEGYNAGCEDPNFLMATQPDNVENPYESGTEENKDYEDGYRAAID